MVLVVLVLEPPSLGVQAPPVGVVHPTAAPNRHARRELVPVDQLLLLWVLLLPLRSLLPHLLPRVSAGDGLILLKALVPHLLLNTPASSDLGVLLAAAATPLELLLVSAA